MAELVNEGEVVRECGAAVCEAAFEQPARTAAHSAATATTHTTDFTLFMGDNSTPEPGGQSRNPATDRLTP